MKKDSFKPQQLVKRVVDVMVSATAVVLLSPLFLATAVAIRLTMGPTVLFVQQRPGLGGRPFRMYKFRTMSDVRDGRGRLLPDGERLTHLGKLLRVTSIDELPELYNVLRGDMSLVGPRPLLMDYLPLYSAEQARRHAVRPGMTGLAQVSGRNAMSWDERFRLDLWYVDHWNLILDARILFTTFVKVLRREGITAGHHATMPRFRGGPSGDLENTNANSMAGVNH